MTLEPKDSQDQRNSFIQAVAELNGIKIKVCIGFVNCHLRLGWWILDGSVAWLLYNEKRVYQYLSKTRTYPSDEPTAIHEGIKGLIDMAVTAAVDSELVVLIKTSLLQFGRSHL